MKNKYVQYFVEGEDEEKLINTLKTELAVIRSGKVQILNVIECKITNAHLMSLHPNTMVVLVFDTDTHQLDTLLQNIEKLSNCQAVSEIVTIPQCHNLEEELVRCCNIKKITELLNSESKQKFKPDIIRVTNLASKLREHQFDINIFWSGIPAQPYHNIPNQSKKIKISHNISNE